MNPPLRFTTSGGYLTRLGDGEATVITANGWIRGQIMRFKQVRGALDRALDRVEES